MRIVSLKLGMIIKYRYIYEYNMYKRKMSLLKISHVSQMYVIIILYFAMKFCQVAAVTFEVSVYVSTK